MFVLKYFLSQLRKMLILLSSLGPIVKFAHCQQYKSRVFVLLAILGNAQILLWDLMSWAKSTFCGVETKSMLKQTRTTAPKMFAKFG